VAILLRKRRRKRFLYIMQIKQRNRKSTARPRPPHLVDAVPPGEANAESVPLTHRANYEHHSPVATAPNFTLAEAMAATTKRHIFVNGY